MKTLDRSRYLATRLSALQQHYAAAFLDIDDMRELEAVLNQHSKAFLSEQMAVRTERQRCRTMVIEAWAMRDQLDQTVQKASLDHFKNRNPELILKLILRLGAYELLVRKDLNRPMMIDAWLDITHCFYEAGTARLANGILNQIQP